ncbi:uncharacterized protein BJX67DRAFT_382296 [Aspergillus lucknowensis]|uniref:Uncharacterized protein n=1 Tax=Aspergillus lucknowensis TaxID=176173 RepID=A0ABR4LMY7_9EURO
MPSRITQLAFGFQALPFLYTGVYYSVLWQWTSVDFPFAVMDGVDTGTVYTISILSLSLGIFYAIAAIQNNTPLMVATIPTRVLAANLFRQSGGAWRAVARVEAAMGLLTVLGVYFAWGPQRRSEGLMWLLAGAAAYFAWAAR